MALGEPKLCGKECAEALVELDFLRKKNTSLQDEINGLRPMLDEVEEDAKIFVAERDSLKAEIDRIGKAAAQVASLRVENVKLQERIKTLEDMNQNIAASNADHVKDYRDIQEVLKNLLKETEDRVWEYGEYFDGIGYCGSCNNPDYEGHKKDCNVGRAIAAAKKLLGGRT